MEAAAETIRHLTLNILPERPHHLAQSPDWRAAYDDHPKRIEEGQNSRLQYMTLVSEADRGVLFTRGYFDIRTEAPRPVPREVTALARSSAKKLSLSDYTNKKKTGTATSASPPDTTPSQSQKKYSDRPISPESRQSEEARRTWSKHGNTELKPRAALNDTPGESSILPPKPSSLPPRPPSPERRKRVSDIDDSSRPLKKPKPTSTPRQLDDRVPGRRDESSARKAPEVLASRDPTPLRDGKSVKAAPPLPNGRGASKSTVISSSRPLSPPPRSRESNGARSNTSEKAERSRGGSIKVDVNPKPSVPLPPLLSPLRLDLDGGKDTTARRAEKRPRDSGVEPSKLGKPRNAEVQYSSKRPKSPFRLPPLLSPTLPAEVEAELERDRKRKGSPRTVEVRAGIGAVESTKRPRLESQVEDGVDGRGRRTYIVTLRVPKKLRQRWSRLEESMSSKGLRQERTGSAGETATSRVAEKRPAGLAEMSSDQPTARKTRAPDVLVPPRIPPSTPSKRAATAMSRVSSSGSLARTPGDAANATPSISASGDRGLTAPEQVPRLHHSKQQSLRELETSLLSMGKRLKHNGDLSLKGRLEHNAATNGHVRASETNIKLGYVLILESTVAFMLGFHAQDTLRAAAGKVSDHNTWLSLFPLLDFVQKDMRRFDAEEMRPLFTISMVVQVFAYDEMLRAQCTHESPPNLTLHEVLRSRRSRDRLVASIREATVQMDRDMCPPVTILATVEDVAEIALRIIRRWCASKGIEYSPELNLRDISIKNML